jgi:hypothetical protein
VEGLLERVVDQVDAVEGADVDAELAAGAEVAVHDGLRDVARLDLLDELPFWSWMQETGQYRAQTEQSMHRSAWMTYFSFLSPVIVWVGHLISQTPQPIHVSVMK